MPRLVDFLLHLAEHPEELAQYRDDPEGFIGGADLTDEQRALLLSRDAQRIQHVIEYELGGELPPGAILGVVLMGVISLFPASE